MDEEMMAALEADGEKLRQLTGKDHGPVFLTEAIEVARHNVRRALIHDLPGPDPNRGVALEQAITELVVAIVANALNPSN